MSRTTVKTRDGRVFQVPTDEEDAQIIAAAMSDPDARPMDDEEWKAALPTARIGRPPYGVPLKSPVTLRLDVDILAALRATGKGWQTRVNDVMREWMKTHAV